MSKPAGKLLFAYQTISTMEGKIDALVLRLNASEQAKAEMESTLQYISTSASSRSPSSLRSLANGALDKVRGMNCQSAPATDGKPHACGEESFQARVLPWMLECFGAAISADRVERNHRFLEEALELVQACGATASEAHQLVDYVYGRDTGEASQEVGGVMVTLAALCLAHKMDMLAAGEIELARIWTKVAQIRAKQAAKPSMSPLPGSYPERTRPLPASSNSPANTATVAAGMNALSMTSAYGAAMGCTCLRRALRGSVHDRSRHDPGPATDVGD